MAKEEKPFNQEQMLDAVERDPTGVPARLLKAAMREFARGGLDSARTQSIATAAGVAVGSLHFHFRDKRTLYQTACGSASRSYARLLGEALANAKPGAHGAEVLLDGFVNVAVKLLVAEPDLPRLLLYRFAKVDVVGDAESHAGDMRLMQNVLVQHFEKCASGKMDAQLLILMAYFGTLLIFSSSDAQMLFLGISPSDPAFAERYRKFARALLRAALMD